MTGKTIITLAMRLPHSEGSANFPLFGAIQSNVRRRQCPLLAMLNIDGNESFTLAPWNRSQVSFQSSTLTWFNANIPDFQMAFAIMDWTKKFRLHMLPQVT